MVDHLQTYAKSFGRIYVFDNTPYKVGEKNRAGSFKDSVFTYYSFAQNLGICVALNVCGFDAFKQGFDYVLLLDQDSDFSPDDVSKLKDDVEHYQGPQAAMFGPTICYEPDKRSQGIPTRKAWHFEDWIITSGTMLSVQAFKAIGPFDPSFFIAYIEPSYCLKARRKGYQIVVFEDVVLYQMQGSFVTYHGKQHRTDAPIREYYVHRNRLYFAHKSFKWYQRGVFYLKSLHDYLRILFHEPDKNQRFAYLKKARHDFRHHSMGRIKE
jgi:rhamnosyltransferase